MAGTAGPHTAAFENQLPVNIMSGKNGYRGILTDIRAEELPFEKPEEFSRDPLEFEQTAVILWQDTQIIFKHACIENRFSEYYLKFCAQLEKNIKNVGSLCLTKAVLEQNGQHFPGLEGMTIRELSGMVSFHLRKCHAALEGIYWDNNYLGMSYLSWEFRWFNLARRLHATETKIQKIREGKISYLPVFGQDPCGKAGPAAADAAGSLRSESLRINANALPLDRSMGSEMLRMEKAREAERRRQEREADRAYGDPGGFMPQPFKPLSKKQIMKEMKEVREMAEAARAEILGTGSGDPEAQPEAPDRPKRELTEEEARAILIERAEKKGDRETALAIRGEDTEEFYQRWLRYIEEKERQNFIQSASRAGPSAETRKKLRKKRKR